MRAAHRAAAWHVRGVFDSEVQFFDGLSRIPEGMTMAKAPPMYELMYIINPVLTDEQTKDIVQRVSAFMKEHSVDVVEVDEMGSRRLAYPIEKKKNGYYVLVNFRTDDGSFIATFDRAMRINDEIMRHLILRYDAKMLRHYQAQSAEPREGATTETEEKSS